MIEDEIMTNDTQDNTSEPEPMPEPEPAPAPEPAPDPEPEEPAAPVEVVTVEELLERLTESREEEVPAEEAEEDASLADDLPDASEEAVPIQVVGMETVLKRLEVIQGVADHPALTTPFEDYTVTEGLLLLLFLSVFALVCVKLLKGGFAWLR